MAMPYQYHKRLLGKCVNLEEIMFLKYFNLLKCTTALQQRFPLDVIFYILI